MTQQHLIDAPLPDVVPRSALRHRRARERAVAFLERLDLPARRSADGYPVGIQATLATGALPNGGIDLYDILDAMLVDPNADDDAIFADDPARRMWREIADMVTAKLGFPLEPELFSNMLFVAHAGRDRHPRIKALCDALLPTFRQTDLDGLFHFFASAKFACDIDCTGMAARALLVTHDIDPRTVTGARTLRRITEAILRSAAVRDVRPEDNVTHGKHNGTLVKNVFKVYLDDHRVQGAACDRGLKINPVVVSNALYAVLFELKRGLRSPDAIVPLKEYVAGATAPRVGSATVAEIVAANVRYATDYLRTGAWREGCRYYPSPDAFLCFYSENVREFPELFGTLSAVTLVRNAIRERRAASSDVPATDPRSSLNTAFRALAATNVGLDATDELDALVARQHDSGAWTDIDCLYSFGSSTSIPVHFRSNILTTALAFRALGGDGEARRVLAADGATWAQEAWATPIVERVLYAMV